MGEPRHFEDLTVGETASFGSRTLERAEAIEFAQAYDPRAMHLNRAAARERGYDDVVASPWHVVCLYTRLLVDNYMGEVANRGGRGLENLRFPNRVTPGAVVTGEVEVLAKSAIERQPVGVVTYRMTALADGARAADWTIDITVADAVER